MSSACAHPCVDCLAISCVLYAVSHFGSALLSKAAPRTNSKLPPKRQVFGPEVKTMFLVTARGEAVRNRGIKCCETDGFVGRGIYFCESAEGCEKKGQDGGTVVVARVHTGKAWEVEGSDSIFADLSVWAESVLSSSLQLVGLAASAQEGVAALRAGESMESNFGVLQQERCDSVRLTGLSTGDEYVIFNEDQVEILKTKERKIGWWKTMQGSP